MFEDKIKKFQYLINQEIDNIYLKGPKLLKNPINHITSGGKRLRPILCMLIADMNNIDIKKSLIPAVSIELLHIFSLVHDDIMDNDDYRHNKPTIHNKWSVPVAILSGDAILALAFKRLNECNNKIKEMFNSALIAVCEGQALDIEYESYDSISLEQYFSMIDLKTGHMLGLSAELGGMISTLNQTDLAVLRKFGQLLGRAFQVQDDLLEVISSKDSMGKSLNSDFLLNKKTFLMIKANEVCSKKISELLLKIKKDPSYNIKREYLHILNKNNIISDTELYIDDIFNNAINILDTLKLFDNNLYEFINYIRRRKC